MTNARRYGILVKQFAFTASRQEAEHGKRFKIGAFAGLLRHLADGSAAADNVYGGRYETIVFVRQPKDTIESDTEC